MENEIKDREIEVKDAEVKGEAISADETAKKPMSTRLKMGIKAGGFNVTL